LLVQLVFPSARSLVAFGSEKQNSPERLFFWGGDALLGVGVAAFIFPRLVSLYTDIGKTGNWQEALSAIDDGTKYGGAPILLSGYVGIRTDFMDVEFEGFQVHTN